MSYEAWGDDNVDSCADWDDGDCVVWAIQIFHNYDCDSPAEDIVNMLIPRSADRLGNERCRTFIATAKIDPATTRQD